MLLALNAVLYLNSNSLIQIEFGLVQQSVFIYNIYLRIFFYASFLWFISAFISIVLKNIINCLGNVFWNYFSMGQQSCWQLSIIKISSESWIYIYLYKMVHFHTYIICHFWTYSASLSGSYHQAGNNKFLTCWSYIHDCTVFCFYLFIYFQFIYRWQVLFHRAIRLAFHKQQGLSQTSGAINDIAECCYRWHQIFETEPQFVMLIKVNTNQNRNAKIRHMHPPGKWHYTKMIW